MSSSLSARKREIRAMVRQRLGATSPQQRHDWSLAIAQLASSTAEWQKARTVLLFLSLPDEVETRPLLELALAQGKHLAVPKVVDEKICQMAPAAVRSLADADLLEAHYGVRIPRGDHDPVPVSEIDLVMIPGVGFSRRGERIGRGKGYYDRFLANPDLQAVVCGLAFDTQVFDELPAEARDRPVGMLVTEKAVLRF